MRISAVLVVAVMVAAATPVVKAEPTLPSEPTLEEVHVWGRARTSHEAGYTTPTSVLLPEDMHSINATTTEDLVKYEPSLGIRRRFIGDANGSMGKRGSKMLHTSRSRVFDRV